jgi:hypothetical protein
MPEVKTIEPPVRMRPLAHADNAPRFAERPGAHIA